eukprot:1657356-Alexandrium_andersonii.AAC.1
MCIRDRSRATRPPTRQLRGRPSVSPAAGMAGRVPAGPQLRHAWRQRSGCRARPASKGSTRWPRLPRH